MHRIDADAHVSNQFSNGDAGIGQPGTKVDADWLNAVQEELVAVITGRGIALVKGTTNQLETALRTRTWTDLTPGTNWTNSAPPRIGQASKDITGVVRLRGLLRSGTGPSSTLTTLPAGMWPPANVNLALMNVTAGSMIHVQIQSNGAVVWPSTPPDNTDVALDGMSFVAA